MRSPLLLAPILTDGQRMQEGIVDFPFIATSSALFALAAPPTPCHPRQKTDLYASPPVAPPFKRQAFAGDAGAGESVFSGNCAACHAGGQNVIMPEKTLEKAALEEYLDGGFNEKAVMKQVTNGKNAMPAFGGRLSDDDIANVAAYVISTASAGWE